MLEVVNASGVWCARSSFFSLILHPIGMIMIVINTVPLLLHARQKPQMEKNKAINQRGSNREISQIRKKEKKKKRKSIQYKMNLKIKWIKTGIH